MTAAVENGSLKPEDLTLEDCKYVLRALEREAFKGVLYALRAQGPLSQYKEVLLDHLKAVFFMDEDDYLAQVRVATNHPLLSKICSELNPSYDNYAEWATAAFSLSDFDAAADTTVASSPLLAKCASSMFRAIDHFNDQVDEQHTNMLKLLQLPKRPYVPERLRRLLQDSEKDVNGRVDVIRERKEKAIRKLPIKRHVGRPRKNEVRPIVKPGRKPKRTKEEKAAERVHKRPRGRPPSVNPAVVKTVRDAIAAATAAAAKEAEDAAAKAAPAPVTVQNGIVEQNGDVSRKPEQEANVPTSTVASPPKEVEVPPYTDAAQSTMENVQPSEAATTVVAGGSSSADELPDSTSGDVEGDDGKSERGRKRKSFLKDPFTSMASQRRKSGDDQCDCARVRPFIFDKPEPGQRNKPIRGNPDKRAIKRSGSMSYPYSAAAVHSQPAEGTAGPSAVPPTAPGPAPASLPLPAHNPHGFTVKQVAYAGPLGAGIGSDVPPVRQHLVVPVTGNTYIARSIPQLKKTYARSTVTGHRYVVAGPPPPNAASPQVVAATYSNPTRPYYGNPSVAATAFARMSTNAEQPSTSGLPTAAHLTGSAEAAVVQRVVVSMCQESQPVPTGENPILAAHQAVATVVAEEIVPKPAASEPRRYVCGAPEQGRISTAPEFVTRCETVTTTCTTVPEPPMHNGPPVETVTTVAEQGKYSGIAKEQYGQVHIPESRSLQSLQAQQLTETAQPGPSSGLDFLATAVTLLAQPVPSQSAPVESQKVQMNDDGNGALKIRIVEAMDTTEPLADSADVRLLPRTSNGADIRYASAPVTAEPDVQPFAAPLQQAPPTTHLDAGFRPAPNCNTDVLAALANFQQLLPPQQMILPAQAIEAAAQLNAPLSLRPDAFNLLAQPAAAPAPMNSATSDLPPVPPVAANTTVESSSGPPQ